MAIPRADKVLESVLKGRETTAKAAAELAKLMEDVKVAELSASNAEISGQLAPLVELIQATQESEAEMGGEAGGGGKPQKLNLPKQQQVNVPGGVAGRNLTEEIDVGQVAGGGGVQAGLKGGGQQGQPFLETRQQTQTTERVPGLGLQPKTTTQITQQPAAPFIAQTILGLSRAESARVQANAARLTAELKADVELNKRIKESGKGLANAMVRGNKATIEALTKDAQSMFGPLAPLVEASARRQAVEIRRKASEEIRKIELANVGPAGQDTRQAYRAGETIRARMEAGGQGPNQTEHAFINDLLDAGNKGSSHLTTYEEDGSFSRTVNPYGGVGGLPATQAMQAQKKLQTITRLRGRILEMISIIESSDQNLAGGPRFVEEIEAKVKGATEFVVAATKKFGFLFDKVPQAKRIVLQGGAQAKSLLTDPQWGPDPSDPEYDESVALLARAVEDANNADELDHRGQLRALSRAAVMDAVAYELSRNDGRFSASSHRLVEKQFDLATVETNEEMVKLFRGMHFRYGENERDLRLLVDQLVPESRKILVPPSEKLGPRQFINPQGQSMVVPPGFKGPQQPGESLPDYLLRMGNISPEDREKNFLGVE